MKAPEKEVLDDAKVGRFAVDWPKLIYWVILCLNVARKRRKVLSSKHIWENSKMFQTYSNLFGWVEVSELRETDGTSVRSPSDNRHGAHRKLFYAILASTLVGNFEDNIIQLPFRACQQKSVFRKVRYVPTRMSTKIHGQLKCGNLRKQNGILLKTINPWPYWKASALALKTPPQFFYPSANYETEYQLLNNLPFEFASSKAAAEFL
jgi:hypothetical protein